jgi:prolyl-tRNA editing enzyme YbaK/EbsC (Cys-tRNA(Pro) deacylase)
VWPEPVERVAAELRAGAAEATIQEFPDGTPTAEAAARAIGCTLAEVLKSIVFVCDESVVVALIPGDRRADESKVAAAVGAAGARVAHAREVRAATGYEPGGVAPFRLPAVETILLEQTSLGHGRVWIGAGSPSHMAGLAPGELQRITGARPVDLVAHR